MNFFYVLLASEYGRGKLHVHTWLSQSNLGRTLAINASESWTTVDMNLPLEILLVVRKDLVGAFHDIDLGVSCVRSHSEVFSTTFVQHMLTSALSFRSVGLGIKLTGFLLLRTCDSLLAVGSNSTLEGLRTILAKPSAKLGWFLRSVEREDRTMDVSMRSIDGVYIACRWY